MIASIFLVNVRDAFVCSDYALRENRRDGAVTVEADAMSMAKLQQSR